MITWNKFIWNVHVDYILHVTSPLAVTPLFQNNPWNKNVFQLFLQSCSSKTYCALTDDSVSHWWNFADILISHSRNRNRFVLLYNIKSYLLITFSKSEGKSLKNSGLLEKCYPLVTILIRLIIYYIGKCNL